MKLRLQGITLQLAAALRLRYSDGREYQGPSLTLVGFI